MKKIFTILFTATLFAVTSSAQDISYEWAIAGGGENADRAAAIANDANGNIYATGVFQNEATFGGIKLKGSEKGSGANFDNSLYLAKMSNGNSTVVWNIYSNKGAVNPTGLTTAANGDVIVVGNVRAVKGGATTSANIIDAKGTETLFEDLADAATGVRGFVARFNNDGEKIWVKIISSDAGKNDVSDVTTDSNGNIYITGYYDKDVTLSGGVKVTSTSDQAAYVAKLDANSGDQAWIKGTTGGLKRELFGTIASEGDNIYIGGILVNQATAVDVSFGGVTLRPSEYPDIVVAKLNANGNFSYVQTRKHITASGNTMLKDLVVDNSKIYLSGNFKGELVFTGGNIVSATNLNGFIASFDAATGNDAWQNIVSCPAITETSALTVADNKVYAFGYFYNKTGANVGSANFGNDIVLTSGDANTTGDLFFAVYNLDGSIVKAEIIAAGDGSDSSMSIASTGDNVYLFGHFNSTNANGKKPLSFYGTTESLTTIGGFDFFIAKYTVKESGNSINNDQISNSQIYVDNNTLYVKGTEVKSVDIYNVSGQIVKRSVYSQGEDNIEISVSSLPKGVYLIKTQSVSGSVNTAKTIF